MNRQVTVLIYIFLLICFTACKNEQNIVPVQDKASERISYTVSDDTGAVLHFNHKPQRIASLSISTDEILLELAGTERIVAISRLADDPGVSNIVKEAKKIPNRVQGNSMEVLLTFKPDLVIIPDFHPPEMIRSVKELGMKVYVYKTPSTIAGVKQSIRQLAAVTDEKKQGEVIIAKMESKIQKVQQRLQSVPPAMRKRVIQMSSDGVFYAPENSFGDVCRNAGVTDATLELHYPDAMEITQEKILELNPDIIFVPAWDYDGKHEPVAERNSILNNPSYQGLKAVRDKKVYNISGALVLTVSQYIADAVEEVARISYPEVFALQ